MVEVISVLVVIGLFILLALLPWLRLAWKADQHISWQCEKCNASYRRTPDFVWPSQGTLLRRALTHAGACGGHVLFHAQLWNKYVVVEEATWGGGREYSRQGQTVPLRMADSAAQAFLRSYSSTRGEILRACAKQYQDAEDSALGARPCKRCGVKMLPSYPHYDEGYCSDKCLEVARRSARH